MSPDVDEFLAAIRVHPVFMAALDADPIWGERLTGVENVLRCLYESGDVRAIETLDAIRAVIRCKTTYKERFLRINELLCAMQEWKH